MIRSALGCAIALATVMACGGMPSAQALTAKECSAKYKAAQQAGTLNGMKWNDFRKAECGSTSVLNRADCRDKLVSAAAQSLKLGAGLPQIRGLVEPYLAADQNLVGADDNGSVATRGNLARFRFGKSERAVGRIAPLCPVGLFE